MCLIVRVCVHACLACTLVAGPAPEPEIFLLALESPTTFHCKVLSIVKMHSINSLQCRRRYVVRMAAWLDGRRGPRSVAASHLAARQCQQGVSPTGDRDVISEHHVKRRRGGAPRAAALWRRRQRRRGGGRPRGAAGRRRLQHRWLAAPARSQCCSRASSRFSGWYEHRPRLGASYPRATTDSARGASSAAAVPSGGWRRVSRIRWTTACSSRCCRPRPAQSRGSFRPGTTSRFCRGGRCRTRKSSTM